MAVLVAYFVLRRVSEPPHKTKRKKLLSAPFCSILLIDFVHISPSPSCICRLRATNMHAQLPVLLSCRLSVHKSRQTKERKIIRFTSRSSIIVRAHRHGVFPLKSTTKFFTAFSTGVFDSKLNEIERN